MKWRGHKKMSSRQISEISLLLTSGIPKLSFLEAKAAIQAPGTLSQGVYAAFEPFMRLRRGSKYKRRHFHGNVFVVDVPYSGANTIDSILKLGKYDWSNTDVSDQHFPQKGIGKCRISLKLIHFKRVIGTSDVLKEFKKRGLRPANPAELLTLGTAHPRLQCNYPIVALGQKWSLYNGDKLVVCLAWHSMLRRVHLLCQFRRDWPAHCRFAAVSK